MGVSLKVLRVSYHISANLIILQLKRNANLIFIGSCLFMLFQLVLRKLVFLLINISIEAIVLWNDERRI